MMMMMMNVLLLLLAMSSMTTDDVTLANSPQTCSSSSGCHTPCRTRSSLLDATIYTHTHTHNIAELQQFTEVH